MIYKINEDVRMTEGDGKITFERNFMGKKEMSEVYGAGVVFVQLIDGERDLDQILEECIKIFGNTVEPYTLAKDLEAFIGDLLNEGIITLVKSPYSNTVRN